MAKHMCELVLMKFQREYQELKKFHIMCLISDVLAQSQKKAKEDAAYVDSINENFQEVPFVYPVLPSGNGFRLVSWGPPQRSRATPPPPGRSHLNRRPI